MQTTLTKTGIEVCYTCTVHLLHSGESLDCEYKSDHTGRDLLEHICKLQNIHCIDYWGLKFVDTASCMEEQRYWLNLEKLIRPQVKQIGSLRFYFRVKIYPPEPYKITEYSIKYIIYQQLKLDLLGGRLFCNVIDASMMVALILQYYHGNYCPALIWMYKMFIKSKILRRERCSNKFFIETEKRALELYCNLLSDLNKFELEDMFLRVASKLDSYGVEPFLLKNMDKEDVYLFINHTGIRFYNKHKQFIHFTWNKIRKLNHQGKNLFTHLTRGGVILLESMHSTECNYIWNIAMSHFEQFRCIPKYFFDNEDNDDDDGDVLGSTGTASGAETHLEIATFYETCVGEFKEISDESNYDESSSTSRHHDIKISPSLFEMLNLKSWKSQLTVAYVMIVLYAMGINLQFPYYIPYIDTITEEIKQKFSELIFNKMLAF